MSYQPRLFPFNFHRFSDEDVLAISSSGDYEYLTQIELETLVNEPEKLDLKLLADLKSKFFLAENNASGSLRLLKSRIAAQKETVLGGPSLHMIVPTLECEHTCKYCQVSRSLRDDKYVMTEENIDVACDTIFQSPSETITVEFQGGDPLLRFDLVKRAIERIYRRNQSEARSIRFVVASTLHQLTEEMCEFFKEFNVFLSTSLDGPEVLHNKNRPLPTKDSYKKTINAINQARNILGPDSVSALMTTTSESLKYPDEIVDEYVSQGLSDIFIRPLSLYGFAKRNEKKLSHDEDLFHEFYLKAFERVLYWNRKGIQIREATAALLFNKILSPFDAGYVDLQSPSGAGLGAVLYNYDGYVYPGDEARMLAEMGDTSLRLGKVGDKLSVLLESPVISNIIESSLSYQIPTCSSCAFNPYCGPDPIAAYNTFGSMNTPVHLTEHCGRHMKLFDYFFKKLKENDPWFLNLAREWGNSNI